MKHHSEFIYLDDHGVIGREYLDQLVQLKTKLESNSLNPEQFDTELMRLKEYAWARIPREYWRQHTPLTFSRAILPTVTRYLNNLQQATKYGLGFTLFSPNPVYKLSHIYRMAIQLADDSSCFVVTYNELIFWLKELREEALLKQELADRFRASFLFLVEIPDQDELTAALKQELTGRLEARRQSLLPTLFAVNSPTQSLDELLPNSFLGKLLLPFSAVNKPLFMEELLPVEQLHEQKWNLLDD